ncbi:Nuclear speckle splicing regulatory protein 1 [Grifola frondosa]|uniref:Nuclear speckle splicing regulatory protein 1 n=1 Tax=Grifola frondosa TaxID=5627 RepID=A0A1C7MEU6_GRIFR|nr:Nuclear speckle splicing regulatory protein 1 [Grifola frondosa]
MIQREREAEGDEFQDKEAFVTQAYKDQMVEVRKAEQEEKMREELEKKKNKGVTSGTAHFFRKLLDESEVQHEQTVAATVAESKPTIGPQAPNLTIIRPPDYTPKSDLELARAAREEGKEVELNDDNQIVDKRDLLSAGLNLSAPNTRRLGLLQKKSVSSEEAVQVHTAVGSAASRKEINQRRAREIELQMEEERERLIAERQRQEEERLNRVVAKRNTQESVQSARERYLERKRRRLEDSEAASAND